MFNFFKNHSAINNASDSFFILLNANARDPEFFAQDGVNDDVDGRFELMALFATAVFLGLANRGEFAKRVSQKVFDTVFKTFDDALRNLGVSDTKVGPKIKKMAEHFYGRMNSYKKALEASSHDIAPVIKKNLADNLNLSDEIVQKLAKRFFELRKKVEDSSI